VRRVRKQSGDLEVRGSVAGGFGRVCFSFCEIWGERKTKGFDGILNSLKIMERI